jgi:hypothetical protein
VRKLWYFPLQLLEFSSEFLTAKVEFTEREDCRLVGIQEPLTLSFEPLPSLPQVGWLEWPEQS